MDLAITYDWGKEMSGIVWGDISAQNVSFSGTVKNYNELKTLMKQIGI